MTISPDLSMKPHFPCHWTAANPWRKTAAFSYLGSTKNFPDRLMKPHFPASFTAAAWSLKRKASSNLGSTMNLPSPLINPHFPSSLTGARKSEKGSASSYCGSKINFPAGLMYPQRPHQAFFGRRSTPESDWEKPSTPPNNKIQVIARQRLAMWHGVTCLELKVRLLVVKGGELCRATGIRR